MKYCVYGGQYGSEGKGSFAEYLIKTQHDPDKLLIAIGENSPNSGHTCSLGKTRNIPAASYFANSVILGPDSAIDPIVLLHDLIAIKNANGKAPVVYIHEHASVVTPFDIDNESCSDIIEKISSTGSGSGSSRALHKQYYRSSNAVVKNNTGLFDVVMDAGFIIHVVSRFAYMDLIRQSIKHDLIFECSQGTLLDNNWGVYPYVTSRPTLPRVATERNGVGFIDWEYAGVFRTFPIRTGGPSGPTGGMEVTFDSVGVEPEIATVTKRTRRIFEFDEFDFGLSIALNRPSLIAFTHLDYLRMDPHGIDLFLRWYRDRATSIEYKALLYLSHSTGQFVGHGEVTL